MKRKMRRFAEGGYEEAPPDFEATKKKKPSEMTDEERYGKVGAEIRRLDPEAFKNRTDKSASANMELLKKLRAKSEKKKPQPEKEVDPDFLLGEKGNPLGEGVRAGRSKLDPTTGRATTLAAGPTRRMGADEFTGRMRKVPEDYLTDDKYPTMMRRESGAFNMKRGGAVKKYSGGGSASKRADGIAQRGKTRGKMC